jgi:hypothetical protein
LFYGSGTVDVTSNSAASNKSESGIYLNASSSTLTAIVDSSYASNNGGYCFYGAASANILLGRSVVTSNSKGIFNGTSSNKLYSYGDNSINKNGSSGSSDIAGTSLNASFTLR